MGKKALTGCPCTYFARDTGDRIAGSYRIDQRLQHFSVMTARNDAAEEALRCPLAAVQDVYTFVEDGERCFQPEMVAKLNQRDKELLIKIVYRTSDETSWFCMLEESPESRDVFLESLNILCIYAQSMSG